MEERDHGGWLEKLEMDVVLGFDEQVEPFRGGVWMKTQMALLS